MFIVCHLHLYLVKAFRIGAKTRAVKLVVKLEVWYTTNVTETYDGRLNIDNHL